MAASLEAHCVLSASTVACSFGLVGLGARREMVCTALGELLARSVARMCEPETPVLPKTRLAMVVMWRWWGK